MLCDSIRQGCVHFYVTLVTDRACPYGAVISAVMQPLTVFKNTFLSIENGFYREHQ